MSDKTSSSLSDIKMTDGSIALALELWEQRGNRKSAGLEALTDAEEAQWMEEQAKARGFSLQKKNRPLLKGFGKKK